MVESLPPYCRWLVWNNLSSLYSREVVILPQGFAEFGQNGWKVFNPQGQILSNWMSWRSEDMVHFYFGLLFILFLLSLLVTSSRWNLSKVCCLSQDALKILKVLIAEKLPNVFCLLYMFYYRWINADCKVTALPWLKKELKMKTCYL